VPNDIPSPRVIALDLLCQVLERSSALSDLLEVDPRLALMSARDRGFAHLLVLTVLRRLGQLDDLIDRRLDDPQLGGAKAGRIARNILRLGAAQLVFLKTPPHAAVDSSVVLAENRQVRRFKKLVNAVLRRISETGLTEVNSQDAARLNTPDWLWKRWCNAFGEESARAIAMTHLDEAPLDISVKASPELWAKRLEARELPTGSIRRAAGGDVVSLPGFSEGEWWVQDAAAALPARLLGNVQGKVVIDLCAAPGGKTAQLAAKGAEVVAVDKSAQRLARLQSNLNRLHLQATTVVADATTWRPDTTCDAVLLDAPCTATGTIRRHPDVARSKVETDVARMVLLQDKLLRSAVEMLSPGGTLVYAVCSLNSEEGLARISSLLNDGAPLTPTPILKNELPMLSEAITSDGFLQTTPALWSSRGGLDGFFVARLTRHTA
jgi:16S rRNA (cytosine967-C5)-methyltransferase